MRTIIITKVFTNGTTKITCRSLSNKCSLVPIISDLDDQVNFGILYSYNIEIIRSESK